MFLPCINKVYVCMYVCMYQLTKGLTNGEGDNLYGKCSADPIFAFQKLSLSNFYSAEIIERYLFYV